jgi:hypothetical protein
LTESQLMVYNKDTFQENPKFSHIFEFSSMSEKQLT